MYLSKPCLQFGQALKILTPGLGTATPWQNSLALRSAPRVDMQDQDDGSVICDITNTPHIERSAIGSKIINSAEVQYQSTRAMADDWETMDFGDFEDAGAAAAAPDVSGASKAADKADVGGGDDDWENMDFDNLTLEGAAAGHGSDLSEIRPAIEKFATKGGADPLVFDNITDKELRTEV